MNNSEYFEKDIVKILPKIIFDIIKNNKGIIEPIGALSSYNKDLCELSLQFPFFIKEVNEKNDTIYIEFEQSWSESEDDTFDVETWQYCLLIDKLLIKSYIK